MSFATPAKDYDLTECADQFFKSRARPLRIVTVAIAVALTFLAGLALFRNGPSTLILGIFGTVLVFDGFATYASLRIFIMGPIPVLGNRPPNVSP